MTTGQTVMRVFGGLLAMTTVAILLGQQGFAQSVEFQRGDHVRVKPPTLSSDPQPSDMVVTVVAIPNDRIRVSDSRVYVNDVPINGFSQELLERVAHSKHTPQVVPQGQYLVMGEVQFTAEDVGNYWGVIPAANLETAGPQ